MSGSSGDWFVVGATATLNSDGWSVKNWLSVAGKIIWLTSWSRVLLEKLMCPQPVKKFPTSCRTWRFITAFTNIHHLSQISPLHASPSYFLKIHLYIILPSVSGSSNWFFPLLLPTKTLYAPLLCPIHATCLAYLIFLDHPNNIRWGIQITKLLVM